MDHEFVCRNCGERVSPARQPPRCPACDGRLEVALDPPTDVGSPADLPTDADRYDVWRYGDWLPTDAPEDAAFEPLTLGEGWTPLVEGEHCSAAAADGASGPTVLLKNETVAPTWSWKDRLNAVVLSHVAALGHDRIACSSTGNHGASVAAYASAADVEETLVLVADESDRPHLAQIRAHGAEAVTLTEDRRLDLLAALADRGWFPTYQVADAYAAQPYVYEAYKTIAFEVVERHGVPDAVAVPVGSGDGLYGIWKGFRELREAGVIDGLPAMVAGETAERAPLTRAYESGAETVGRDDGPMPISVSTKGSWSGSHALDAVRASGGAAYAVEQSGVERALERCGRDGVFVEPAGALSAAAVPPAVADGVVAPDETVVAVATGPGSKWPDIVTDVVGETPRVEPRLDALPVDVAESGERS